MNKKYKFTGKSFQYKGITLHRIQALRTFGNVIEGAIGGWIEKEENLSHEGDCWVDDDAWVSGDARVIENAQVCDDAWVSGKAWVGGNAVVGEDARVYDDAGVNGSARVSGDTKPSSDTLPEELNTFPESVEEVTIKGVKYKKVTKWEKA